MPTKLMEFLIELFSDGSEQSPKSKSTQQPTIQTMSEKKNPFKSMPLHKREYYLTFLFNELSRLPADHAHSHYKLQTEEHDAFKFILFQFAREAHAIEIASQKKAYFTESVLLHSEWVIPPDDWEVVDTPETTQSTRSNSPSSLL